jgi:O-antigen ligase
VLDLALAALLGVAALQALPLPLPLARVVSPAREGFLAATSLHSVPALPATMLPLTIDLAATLHAWVSLLCIVATFWVARGIFARGGIRTFSTVIAWGAIVLAIVAFAQHSSGTTLVYGFWHPRDAGARPLGPFVNRNHFGTWSIMAVCLCAGYLQWRQLAARPTGSWRASVARSLDGRRLVLQLAVGLTAAVVALGASRSALVALACAAGYVALSARGGGGIRSRGLSLAAIASLALVGMLGYGDGERLLLRIDQTRASGMADRTAIWRDALPLMSDFPLSGVGAGAFGSAMRVYQTSRTYHYNEAHNQYLQLVAEGGVLLTVPAVIALAALLAAARRQLRREDDPLRWMRVAAAGALVGVAVQSIWETGLTLPANGMFAAALAALLVTPAPAAVPIRERS